MEVQLDALCDLALLAHRRSGGVIPILNSDDFLNRNLANLATSFSNMNRSHARQIDFIFASIITKQPSFFLVDHRSTPFRISTRPILEAFARLDEDGLGLLERVAKSVPAHRKVREVLTQVRIGQVTPQNDNLAFYRSRLARQLFPILSSLAIATITDSTSALFTTLQIPTIVEGVISFMLAQVEWTVENWRVAWKGTGKAVSDVTTMGEWIVASGGEEREVHDDDWVRGKKGKKNGKNGKNGKNQKDVNHDEEIPDTENKALVGLKVLMGRFAHFRRRPLVSQLSVKSPLIRSKLTVLVCYSAGLPLLHLSIPNSCMRSWQMDSCSIPRSNSTSNDARSQPTTRMLESA